MKAFIITICVLAAAFGALMYTSRDMESMEDILGSPQEYQDTKVKLQGKIEQRIAYGNEVVVIISHDELTIPVLGQGDVPGVGKKVVVEGVVRPGITLEDTRLGTCILAEKIREPHFWEKIPLPEFLTSQASELYNQS
jgi:hypothetical protein